MPITVFAPSRPVEKTDWADETENATGQTDDASWKLPKKPVRVNATEATTEATGIANPFTPLTQDPSHVSLTEPTLSHQKEAFSQLSVSVEDLPSKKPASRNRTKKTPSQS